MLAVHADRRALIGEVLRDLTDDSPRSRVTEPAFFDVRAPGSRVVIFKERPNGAASREAAPWVWIGR